jgi:arylsulfatase A-like enzyme
MFYSQPRNVRHFRHAVLAALCLLAMVCVPHPAQAEQNILLIIGDDIGIDAMGLYTAGDKAPTPTLDGLAAGGVRFTDCWANPVCSPTRATMLTGKHGFQTGVGWPGHVIGPGEFTVADALNSAGYATACIGKWHLSTAADNPNAMGFDHYSGNLGGFLNSFFTWNKTVNGVTSTVNNYATSENVDDAIAWITTQGSDPWFCWVAFNAAHTPFHKPPNDLHSYDYLPGTTFHINNNPGLYFKAMIEAMDTEIGRLIAGIDADVLANTTILFLGDNGTDRRVYTGAERGSKGVIYQGGVHVPCIVAGAAVTGGNRTHDGRIHSVDFFETIIELAGIDPNEAVSPAIRVDSRSFLAYLEDPAQANFHEYALAERFQTTSVDADGKTIRNAGYKLNAYDDASGTEELFDIISDPNETTNLLAGSLTGTDATNYDDLSNRLTAMLTDFTPPTVTAVDFNAVRTVSDIEPSGVGVQTIEITFSENVAFEAADVTVQKVTFPGGSETVGDTLTPTSITGSGTDTMTITFDIASVVDTWVKVTLDGNAIEDAVRNKLDGEAASAGSGRGYIYDASDMPTGDATAGGDAVFYVGSLRCDLHGGSFPDGEPNGALDFLDVLAFNEAYEAGNLDADLHGDSFGDPVPNGVLTFLDVLAFNELYEGAASLDDLPASLSGAAAVKSVSLSEPELQATSVAVEQEEPAPKAKAKKSRGKGRKK